MAEETLEAGGAAPDSGDPGRVKRPPPTIELEATSVTTGPASETAAAPADRATEPQPEAGAEVRAAKDEEQSPRSSVPPFAPSPTPRAAGVSPWVIAPFSGAVAAALVIGVGWMLGWPPVQSPSQVNVAVVDDLGKRLAAVEAKAGKPVPDPAATARTDALDKALAALRADVTKQRSQSDQLAADLNGLKAAGSQAAAAPVDLSGVNERIARLEQTARAQNAAIANESQKIAEAKPADDLALRRVVAAALLDVAVRHGDPYAAMLTTAKSLAPDSEALKPLDTFAASGVPNPGMLNRDLLALVPKLTPPATESTGTTGSGLVDKLQAGAARLVHIERTDAAGTDRNSIVARVTAAALRNDFGDARKELNTLAPADRGPAQAWLDKANARDAALAASRRFADDAMAALAKPVQ